MSPAAQQRLRLLEPVSRITLVGQQRLIALTFLLTIVSKLLSVVVCLIQYRHMERTTQIEILKSLLGERVSIFPVIHSTVRHVKQIQAAVWMVCNRFSVPLLKWHPARVTCVLKLTPASRHET